MTFYVEVFKVTENCRNGNVRTITKEVLVQPFKIVNGEKHHRITADRVASATKILEEQFYYDIQHIKTLSRDVLMVVD